YQYSIDECDVLDKPLLVEFRAKREKWISWLKGAEPHSVWTQINTMMWNDAVFRTVNESRGLAARFGSPSAVLNGFLGGFIDRGYVVTQVLAIRRLVESPRNNVDQQPISLRRVLKDVRCARDLMTRENYVAYDGAPYDFKKQEAAHSRELADSQSTGGITGQVDSRGPNAWARSKTRHRQFDRLSGIEGTPSRKDLIHETVFRQISDRLAVVEIDQIGRFADKFVAHAADERSQSALSDEDRKITLEKINQCQRAIVDTANMIGSFLWEGGCNTIPMPPYGHLKDLDQPWLPKECLGALQAFWVQHCKSIEEWQTPEVRAKP
ncbi:MAG: hypothetical protein RBS99_13650, partial [Rhodospirillales bacterium]|nr:hypothetical protein [Rhodospirillales bacterium]